MSENTLSIRARKKAKAQIENAARENHIAKFTQRMELVRHGTASTKKRDFKSALSYYLLYIEALKRGKNVTVLAPSIFDPTKEAAELLMITGVLWDIAKIYDKINAKDKSKLKYFIDVFILFSKGTKFEKLSKEMLRKFLTNGNPNNRAIFKEAHIKLGGGKCFIATAVEEHCEVSTIITLRRFRDEVLSKNSFGRGFIQLYYKIGPTIAIQLIRSSEEKQKRAAKILGRIANAISFRFFQDEK